jgi:hypothetical protein
MKSWYYTFREPFISVTWLGLTSGLRSNDTGCYAVRNVSAALDLLMPPKLADTYPRCVGDICLWGRA